MNCLHPWTRKYQDAATGQWKEVVCPCGKCINCLHAYQDMWVIRLQEEAKSKKTMIYDTLTVRPTAMHTLVDYTKPDFRLKERFPDGTLYGTTERYALWKVNAIKKHYKAAKRYYPHMSKESYDLLRRNNFKLPCLPVDEVQRWVKRGRQFMFRDKGYRPDFSYFIVQEYGAQTSRPHFHVLFFGLNYSDYMHYFGNQWREEFGWTKPVYKEYNAVNQKDYSCIVRYVSKYVSKGVFESPWVKDRMAPKPYRLISKGLGAGYLQKDFFKVFTSPEFNQWKAISCPSEQSYINKCNDFAHRKEWRELYAYKTEYKNKRALMDTYMNNKWTNEFHRDCCEPSPYFKEEPYVDISHFTEDDYKHLQVYYDAKGFPHALPRYYKYKLLKNSNNEPNIYQFEVQNVLQSRARVHDNQGLQKFAATLGYYIADEYLESSSPLQGLSPSEAFMVGYKYTLAKASQAQVIGERRFTRLTNFYNRAKMNKTAEELL